MKIKDFNNKLCGRKLSGDKEPVEKGKFDVHEYLSLKWEEFDNRHVAIPDEHIWEVLHELGVMDNNINLLRSFEDLFGGNLKFRLYGNGAWTGNTYWEIGLEPCGNTSYAEEMFMSVMDVGSNNVRGMTELTCLWYILNSDIDGSIKDFLLWFGKRPDNKRLFYPKMYFMKKRMKIKEIKNTIAYNFPRFQTLEELKMKMMLSGKLV